MKFERKWVTPLVGGSFLLIAVTGILMFFHVDTGLNKVAHEWLGLLMVVAIILHIMLNFKGFKNSFDTFSGRVINGIFIVLLALSFCEFRRGKARETFCVAYYYYGKNRYRRPL